MEHKNKGGDETMCVSLGPSTRWSTLGCGRISVYVEPATPTAESSISSYRGESYLLLGVCPSVSAGCPSVSAGCPLSVCGGMESLLYALPST